MALMLTAAGCGDSGHPVASTTSPAGGSAAASELVASADTICKRVDSVLVSTPRGALDLHALAHSAPRNAALERAALAELDKLRPPPQLARDWARIVAYRRTLADELAKLGRAAGSNDRPTVQALATSKKRVHDELYAIANRDGFKECSQVSADAQHAGKVAPKH